MNTTTNFKKMLSYVFVLDTTGYRNIPEYLGYFWYLLNKNMQCMVNLAAFLSYQILTAKAKKWKKTAKQLTKKINTRFCKYKIVSIRFSR